MSLAFRKVEETRQVPFRIVASAAASLGREGAGSGSSDGDSAQPKISASNVNVYYGDKQALFDVNLDIPRNQVTALIGPSGCGKSTFLRCLNRMNDVIEDCRFDGRVVLDGEDIYLDSQRGLRAAHSRLDGFERGTG